MLLCFDNLSVMKRGKFFVTLASWCSGSTLDCCFNDPVSLTTLACSQITMLRLGDDDLFCKYDFQPFVGQTLLAVGKRVS